MWQKVTQRQALKPSDLERDSKFIGGLNNPITDPLHHVVEDEDNRRSDDEVNKNFCC
jgi:hypothetical protein